MPIVSRNYNPESDFTAIQAFLLEIFIQTKSFQNWLPSRFENNHMDWIQDIRIWEETNQQRIMAVANPENKNIYFIQIRPGEPQLFDKVINWIELHFMKNRPDDFKDQKINVISLQGDQEREEALIRSKFSRGKIYGILRVREMGSPIPKVTLPKGFKIRSVIGRKDFRKLASNIRIVFGHGDWFTANVLERLAQATFYVKDLDLVAEAPNGDIASFCTFRIDPVSKAAELEPMGTLPEYRGLGLAKALMIEGIKRLKKFQPLFIYIDGAADNPAANRLYETMGFENRGTYFYWSKNIS